MDNSSKFMIVWALAFSALVFSALARATTMSTAKSAPAPQPAPAQPTLAPSTQAAPGNPYAFGPIVQKAGGDCIALNGTVLFSCDQQCQAETEHCQSTDCVRAAILASTGRSMTPPALAK